jgi:hypothetical protein
MMPLPAWAHLSGVGWFECMFDEESGSLAFREQPPVEDGTQIMCIPRVEGEDPPSVEATARLLTSLMKERGEL